MFVDEADPTRLLPALERIAELPIERLIIPHGAVLEPDGAAQLRAAVAEVATRLGWAPLGGVSERSKERDWKSRTC